MKKLVLAISAMLPALWAGAAPYAIQHVEPMNWWVGMKSSDLQVMVHGEKIAELAPALAYPGVRIASVERTDNPNFLFVNLKIGATTKPGELKLQFKRGKDVVTTVPYRLDARRKDSAARRGFDSGDAVYLIVPDRFANGNPANDDAGMREKSDRGNPDGRHGGDLAGMQAQLDYIRNLGFTMVWPTPLLENNQQAYSYHGYALTDYYKIDPRFGSNEDYRNYVAAANARGIGVIHDVVVNHIGTGHWWMHDMPSSDWINHGTRFVKTNNQHTVAQDIHAAPEDKAGFVDGWFDTTMPDVNQKNKLVARYLIQNTLWWIEYANLSGIREDTYSYADPAFLNDWNRAVRAEYPHLNVVGEEMDDRPYMVAYWQKGVVNRDGFRSELPSVMDFPLVDAAPKALTAPEDSGQGLIRIYETIAADYLYADPLKLMVFPDNHDRPRALAQVDGNVDLLKTDLVLMATTRGIPQVFYGTEMLIQGPKQRTDGVLRADMPGGWAGDTVNAFTGTGLTDAQRDMQHLVRTLFNWRKTSSAVKYGKLTHYMPSDGHYVYFRHDGRQTVMVVLNKNPQATQLDLARFAGMVKQARQGRNVLTGAAVDLRAPLALPAMTSVVVEW
ncbi:alpha-amlyase [Massilia sp. Root133]|uniref:Alpha-amylase n=1 Tax=Massilia cellulosiltytica TaxID=2683234 RepID=A0A7X3K8G1_9BURK|nr:MULTISPECIES: glycoside hydrolase family 13 protein [Telluria group]KQY05865.1 alpha-amlyase [Massilia sp. Root133]KQZ52316.1 alpha-amlyase [Massilia sp. Root1485]MVW60946.1 alpha-amylase [Telluria cellulosilytica]